MCIIITFYIIIINNNIKRYLDACAGRRKQGGAKGALAPTPKKPALGGGGLSSTLVAK